MSALQAGQREVQQGISDDDLLFHCCGVYAKECPANKITVTDRVRFSDRCEVCYACLHNCPQDAVRLKKEASPVHFRNEHITRNETTAANE